jgi:CRISPR/Cas system type I-B associated protein Csh2 (Cas7 group RAMP superfamily)
MGKTKARVSALLAPSETGVFSSKEVESLLKGLMTAFENSSSAHYGVKKAKTSITMTRTAQGKLELSLGVSVFKVLDAEGNLKGEVMQGIEIEIERTQ